MAVLVEGFSVVVTLDSIGRHLPGGWPTVARLVRGATTCTGGRLGCAAFMAVADARELARALTLRQAADPAGGRIDAVVVCQLRGPLSACDWLRFERRRCRSGGWLATARHRDDTDPYWAPPPGWR